MKQEEIDRLIYINKQTPEDALKIYKFWLENQTKNKDKNILKILHASIQLGLSNIVKTILSSEEGCIEILSDESLLKEALNCNPLNLDILNALYSYHNTMTSLPFDDSAIQGHIVDAFQDREGNLYPGDGSSSSTWKFIKAFKTTTGKLIELTPDLRSSFSSKITSNKRKANEPEDPIQHKQIKIEGMPKAIFKDNEGRLNINADASREEIILAQEFLANQLELVEAFAKIPQTNHSSAQIEIDPLSVLAGVAATAAIHDTNA
jgi:hypothetical protein